MKLLRQSGLIFGLCFLGDFIQRLFSLPLPGSVIGMILLFLALYFKIIKADMLKEISSFLLEHLAFFFIPAGVGLLAYTGVLKTNGLAIGVISIITTILVALVTGGIIEAMKRRVNR